MPAWNARGSMAALGARPLVVTDQAKVAESSESTPPLSANILNLGVGALEVALPLIRLRAGGKSLGEIATEMGLSNTTVARIARDGGIGPLTCFAGTKPRIACRRP